MKIRNLTSTDYVAIISVVNEWWGGREMTGLLPRLFFDHFQDTSFVIEEKGTLKGFLIGFLSQSKQKEAYIHFVGIEPNCRKKGYGRRLYQTFFNEVRKKNVQFVRCITSPSNFLSIAYHTKMGFLLEEGDKQVNDIPIHSNYDGEEDRVLFVKTV